MGEILGCLQGMTVYEGLFFLLGIVMVVSGLAVCAIAGLLKLTGR